MTHGINIKAKHKDVIAIINGNNNNVMSTLMIIVKISRRIIQVFCLIFYTFLHKKFNTNKY